jgi:5'-3' exonuclease
VGNDFLPHVALLQIEQRGLEHLFEVEDLSFVLALTLTLTLTLAPTPNPQP